MAAEFLDCVSLTVPAEALEAFEAALGSVCRAVSFFHDEERDVWDLQGVKERGAGEDRLAAALAMAELMTGVSPAVARTQTPAGGWIARTQTAFPEQLIGKNFAVRGTHLPGRAVPGRIPIILDAGLAFGSGEHASTRGCLLALEQVAKRRRPARILDVGTGSGVLAIAAAKWLRRPVLATDIDPRAVRVARANAAMNQASALVTAIKSNGYTNPEIRRRGPYDLIFANILARPLCAMAKTLARNLRPGGHAILAGLLTTQARWVITAHRRAGLFVCRQQPNAGWTTLVVRRLVSR